MQEDFEANFKKMCSDDAIISKNLRLSKA